MPALSVCVLVLNEAAVLERCLQSVAWAAEVVVIDSGSTDDSRAIAAAAGARVVQREWLGFPAQRNAGASACVNDWVLMIDADEVVTPTLRRSIEQTLAGDPDPQDGYSVDRRTEFLGSLLNNEQTKGKQRTFIRMYNRTCSEYPVDEAVHERVQVTGRLIPLGGVLVQWRPEHLRGYAQRGARYASLEATLMHERGSSFSQRKMLSLPLARCFWLLIARHQVSYGTRGLLHTLYKAQGDWLRHALLWAVGDPKVQAALRAEISTLYVDNRQIVIREARGSSGWAVATSLVRFMWALTSLQVSRAPVQESIDRLLSKTADWLDAGEAWEAKQHPVAADPPGRYLK